MLETPPMLAIGILYLPIINLEDFKETRRATLFNPISDNQLELRIKMAITLGIDLRRVSKLL